MYRRKTYNYTEEAFLLSTFSEFVKCWKSSKRSCLFIESVNGMAFMNFSVFLGNPSEAHSPHYTPHPQRRQPSSKENKRKKSSKKIQRDNERAAKFQAKKRQEQASASAANGNPLSTSSPTATESSVRAASVNFSFASPVAEDKTSNAMECVSDHQLTPEDLRHQLEDPPSLTLSHEGETVKENPTEPISDNITITEEVPQENKETASEETESPGLEFDFVQDVEAVRRKFQSIPDYFGRVPGDLTQHDWVKQSKWFQKNIATASSSHGDNCFDINKLSVFKRRILRCKKPKLFVGTSNEEPCNSPAYECCLCSPRTPKKPWK